MSAHTHRTHERNRLQQKRKIVEILRTVPHEKGFHFYTARGSYAKETAMSLDASKEKSK